MSMQKLYRIIDLHTGDVLANSQPSLDCAVELLHLLELDHPDCTLEVESYTVDGPAVNAQEL